MSKTEIPLARLAPDNGFPRRARMDLHTPTELAIRNAVDHVERLGADLLLTQAVILLDQAREKVADWLEGAEGVLPEKAVQKDTESGWLIEIGQLCIGWCDTPMNGIQLNLKTFTDPTALRFARKEDAEAFARLHNIKPTRILEHLWG